MSVWDSRWEQYLRNKCLNVCRIYVELEVTIMWPADGLIRLGIWSEQDQVHSEVEDLNVFNSFMFEVWFKGSSAISNTEDKVSLWTNRHWFWLIWIYEAYFLLLLLLSELVDYFVVNNKLSNHSPLAMHFARHIPQAITPLKTQTQTFITI